MDRYNQRQNSSQQNSNSWDDSPSSYYQGWTPSRDMNDPQRSRCQEQYNRGLALASLCSSPPSNFKREPPSQPSSSSSVPPVGDTSDYGMRGYLKPPPLPPSFPSFSSNNESTSCGPETSSPPMKLPVEDRSAFPTFRYMKFKKEIVIFSKDSRNPLNYQHLTKLMEDILERVVTAEGERVKPRFFGVKTLDKRLVLYCGDNTTVYWLKNLINELSSSYPMGLQVNEHLGEETKYTLVANFQNSVNDSNERILTFLKNQNEGLDVSRWEVVGRASKKHVVQLTLLIDYDSAELLRRKGERLSYKFGVTRMVLENHFGGKLKDDQLENDPSTSSTSRLNNPLPFSNQTADMTSGPDGLANTTLFTGSKRKPMTFKKKLKKLRKKQSAKLN